MQQTENYQLGLWELSDQVTHDAFNENTEKIDGALAGLATSIAAAAHIATGTYTGNGKSGSKNTLRLEFGFQPKFLMVWGHSLYSMKGVKGQKLVIDPGCSDDPAIEQTATTWGSNYISWYNDDHGTDSSSYGYSQMNTKNTTYSYVAIG